MESREGAETEDIVGGDALCPPELFGIVAPGIFRSNVPLAVNFSYFRLLQLRSVLLLSAEFPTRLVTTFLEENGIELRHLGQKSLKSEASWKPMSDEMVKEGLEYLLNVDNHPIVVCDTSGRAYYSLPVVNCFVRTEHVGSLRNSFGWDSHWMSPSAAELESQLDCQ
eukprot:Plantae.Rhodophyta-Purpureofilum_apyrenoidigerum.ctg195.p1 GENE.Plantae.Rhodophyta-Purpureofilum_apyrenoidigerum.ctg195~~Plantae.Rhodophyta-Purpureofilum_apyrenoidigerum.ctg195.p1  ORF type:complete len:167 (-),score=18.12 Plantae.Rhodophyta-Purpureofilum_apyrenoidigerum.ctg195:403-903(-)